MTGPNVDLEARVAELEAERRQLSAFNFRSGNHGVPNPRLRTCHNCGLEVELNDNWECPTLGCERHDGKPMQVFRTTEKVDCDECGGPGYRIWVFNAPGEIRSDHCGCKKSPAQIRRDREHAKRLEYEAAKNNQALADARKARDCWEAMGRECHITHMQPQCYACIRYGGKYQGMLREHERQQRASNPGPEFEEIT